MDARSRFVDGLLVTYGCTPALGAQPGVSVEPFANRAGSQVAAGYLLGERLVISCDPAVTDAVVAATTAVAPTLESWKAAAVAHDAELLGAGRMQVLPLDIEPAVDVPEGYRLTRLDRDDPADVALIAELIEISDEDDLDEAEIALDELDADIYAVLDDAGAIAAFSSSRPFDNVDGYGDIGIMTRADSRSLGLGKAAVAQLCGRLREQGIEPLYRCDEDNLGSVSLSVSMGFEIATQLVAYRFMP